MIWWYRRGPSSPTRAQRTWAFSKHLPQRKKKEEKKYELVFIVIGRAVRILWGPNRLRSIHSACNDAAGATVSMYPSNYIKYRSAVSVCYISVLVLYSSFCFFSLGGIWISERVAKALTIILTSIKNAFFSFVDFVAWNKKMKTKRTHSIGLATSV